VELPFRIKFSLSRKLSGYELPAISKWQNVSGQSKQKLRKKLKSKQLQLDKIDIRKFLID
jgi:hypothetical protein